mmetsp:Transcript_12041/g.16343  ORF Transcript_12041/g.16343 Transcript_12041/m.16343 type:complete len:210 (+) Transcript_12041:284-913(+)
MKASYNAIGDPFKEAALTMVRKENRETQIAAGNEKAFKPVRHVRQPTNAAYEHMKDFEHVQKNYRDEENNREVMIAPRNFLVNPPKQGRVGKNTFFSGAIGYMESDFDRPKQIAKRERLAGEALMQDKPFSQKVKQTHLFNSFKDVIGEDVPIPAREPSKPRPIAMEHDKPFKPSHPPRVGINKTLAPFPHYMEDPKKPLTRKIEEDDG